MIADQVRHIFNSSSVVAVYHHNDLTVSEWEGLRIKLEKKNMRIKVVPSKVTMKVLETTKYKNVSLLLRGCSAIAYSAEPQIPELLSVMKPEPKLHLLGGVVEDTLVTPEGLRSLAKLPKKTALYQQLLGTLMLPQTLLSTSLVSNQMRLSQMLGQLVDRGQTD